MRPFIFGVLLLAAPLASVSAEVTVDFDYDTSITGGVDRIVFRGNILLDFSVDANGTVTLDASLSDLNQGEIGTTSDLAVALVNEWDGTVGTVSTDFAGESFTVALLPNPSNIGFKSFYVFENTGGNSGSLGMFVVNLGELEDVFFESAVEEGSTAAFADAQDWLLEQVDDDVILNAATGTKATSLQGVSETMFMGIGQDKFNSVNTGLQFTEFTYTSASDPLTSDPHILVQDITGQQDKLDLSAATSGSVDLSGMQYFLTETSDFFGGFNEIQIGAETIADDPTATVSDGAALTGISFDLFDYYAGDLNQDSVMNQIDIDLFSAGWKTDTTGMNYYDALFLGDVNWDGIVDGEDWILVRESFEQYSLNGSSEPVLPGDFNGDGIVDAADYAVFRNNLGAENESSLNGAGDGMNGVDAGDYELWRANFGASIFGAGGGSATIPEPATTSLIAALSLGCFLVRSRK